MSKAECDAYIKKNHRHHKPIKFNLFRVGAFSDGVLVGVCQVMRPCARALCDGETVEVSRLCTDGTPNACSFLYAKAARIAKEYGFKKIITYILDSESGISLRASGWTFELVTRARSWNQNYRQREDKGPVCPKQRWAKNLCV